MKKLTEVPDDARLFQMFSFLALTNDGRDFSPWVAGANPDRSAALLHPNKK